MKEMGRHIIRERSPRGCGPGRVPVAVSERQDLNLDQIATAPAKWLLCLVVLLAPPVKSRPEKPNTMDLKQSSLKLVHSIELDAFKDKFNYSELNESLLIS